jgi:hypothetical protein
MEPVKPREQFFEPDPRWDSFVTVDVTTGECRRMTLDDYYRSLEDFSLNSAVPEEVVSYVNMVKMLFLNGWLCYPFFATCECFSAMAVEMALRMRLPTPAGKRDRRGLKEMMTEAVEGSILRDSGFRVCRTAAQKQRVSSRLSKKTAASRCRDPPYRM